MQCPPTGSNQNNSENIFFLVYQIHVLVSVNSVFTHKQRHKQTNEQMKINNCALILSGHDQSSEVDNER